jgi:hypothetical protein
MPLVPCNRKRVTKTPGLSENRAGPTLDSRFRGNDGLRSIRPLRAVTPAEAGVQAVSSFRRIIMGEDVT